MKKKKAKEKKEKGEEMFEILVVLTHAFVGYLSHQIGRRVLV